MGGLVKTTACARGTAWSGRDQRRDLRRNFSAVYVVRIARCCVEKDCYRRGADTPSGIIFCREGIPAISKCGRPENRRVVRFLYWCPCRNSEHPDTYSGRPLLSPLFSYSGADRAERTIKKGAPACAGAPQRSGHCRVCARTGVVGAVPLGKTAPRENPYML